VKKFRVTYGLWFWFLFDGLIWFATQWGGLYLRLQGTIPSIEYEYFFRFAPLSTAGLLGAYFYTGVYRRDLDDDWRWRNLWWGWISAVSIAMAVLFFLQIPYSRSAFLVGAMMFFAVSVGSRTFAEYVGFGLSETGDQVVVIGFDEEESPLGSDGNSSTNNLKFVNVDPSDPSFLSLQQHRPDVILVNGSRFEEPVLKRLHDFGSRRQIPVRIVPTTDQLFFSETSQVRWQGTRLLRSDLHYRLQQQMAVKAVFDYVLGTILLLFFLPVIIVTAGVIACVDGRPIFFTQERTGRSGEKFHVFKFRTMVPEAEKQGPKLTKGADDPRITKLGRCLRRWSLDELPQLFNVVRGEMSLVGPRPELPSITNNYEPEQLRVLWLKPGLTGLSQVQGRQELELEEKLDIDQRYLMDYSVGLDLWILLKTVWAVILGKGAN
jgi:exopolysaccharide biosynthesis polyprenyl glycosylphosphotransferase